MPKRYIHSITDGFTCGSIVWWDDGCESPAEQRPEPKRIGFALDAVATRAEASEPQRKPIITRKSRRPIVTRKPTPQP